MRDKKEFIFRELASGKLDFIGDFDGLYKNELDPWSQSGNTGEISRYYDWSRKRLVDNIYPDKNSKILEIGSGLGFVTKLISDMYTLATCYGLDISNVAVTKS
tara:strand:- start:268 stop:576 length:309 start_codon:yes stop_codon:yes gene_type:complete